MSIADEVTERALALAETDLEPDRAVVDILAASGGRRVSVVLARQRVEAALRESPGDRTQASAMELLELALERGSWGLE